MSPRGTLAAIAGQAEEPSADQARPPTDGACSRVHGPASIGAAGALVGRVAATPRPP